MKILYSDQQIVLCVKPLGLDSEHQMPQALEQELTGSFFPVHRLDKNVGGLMVYARTKEAAAWLSQSIQAGRLQKEYLAICHGAPPKEGRLQDLLFKDNRAGKTYVVKRPRNGVREARLTYEVLEQREDTSLLHIALETGRSHQIRVQFASRGWPLLGDKKYGGRDSFTAPALWSYKLSFPHPSGEILSFNCPPEGAVWELYRK